MVMGLIVHPDSREKGLVQIFLEAQFALWVSINAVDAAKNGLANRAFNSNSIKADWYRGMATIGRILVFSAASLVFLAVAVPYSEAGGCGCPPFWTAFQDHCYR